MLLARTLYQQKVNVAGFFSILGGGFNYKFVKEMPDVSQYMMDVNHWYNPKREQAQALKKRVEAAGEVFTFEVYLAYTDVELLADSLEHAGSADKEKLTAALAASTFKAELMPYGPTKFVNGQNEGAQPAVMQSLKGDIEVIAPARVRLGQGGVPQAEAHLTGACSIPQIIFAGVLNGLAGRRHLCAGGRRPDADLRRPAHHQLRPWQPADAGHVRRLLPLAAGRHRSLRWRCRW